MTLTKIKHLILCQLCNRYDYGMILRCVILANVVCCPVKLTRVEQVQNVGTVTMTRIFTRTLADFLFAVILEASKKFTF